MRRSLGHLLRTKMAAYFGLALICFSALTPSVALALDTTFFSNNDILFYNPEDCAVSSVGANGQTNVAVVGNDNAEKVFNFLTTTNFAATGGKPFTAVQATGALGNFQQESSMNPASVEGNGNGHGLAQWSFERWTQLQSVASSQGKDWTDLSVQLLMLGNELNNVSGFSAEGTRLAAFSGGAFGSVSDPAQASYLFQASYERAGDPVQANRNSAAMAYYQQFKDKAPSTSTTSTSTTPGGCATAGRPSGNFADNAQFTFFKQCDTPWGPTILSNGGTFCNNGCGPTSIAMAIKNMAGQGVTPSDTMNYVSDHNLWNAQSGGTSFDTTVQIAARWGLKGATMSASQAQNLDYIRSVLSSGGLVMVAGYGPAPYYGKVAHFVLIRAITADGHILIANPAPTGGNDTDNTKQWDSGDIINGNTFGGVAITK